jgi:hypothetical protein
MLSSHMRRSLFLRRTVTISSDPHPPELQGRNIPYEIQKGATFLNQEKLKKEGNQEGQVERKE